MDIIKKEIMKILTVVGARPQFIKAATISRVISKRDNIQEVIVHTGQHFDANMSDVFFEEMSIPKPDYHLQIDSLGHGAMTGRMLEKIEQVLWTEKPDWVLVYGDTNSTLAGALAASKLHINVAHVEAGLRSFNMKMPEEQNRILTDKLSSVLFTPTDEGIKNLASEGYDVQSTRVQKSGDVMYDAAQFYAPQSTPPIGVANDVLTQNFVLATIHRAENTDDPYKLRSIVRALNRVHQETPVLLPLHPRTQKIIANLDIQIDCHVLDPVGYLEMVYLLQHCAFVASDSGGLQKEAYFFSKQCLVLREETEWTELVEHGANTIVGADFDKILSAVKSLNPQTDFTIPFYGDGHAAEAIVDTLMNGGYSIY